MNKLGDTGRIRCIYTDAYPIGIDNFGLGRGAGLDRHKATGRLLIGLAVLENPVLKGRKFDVMQTTEVFLDHRRGVPLLDQIKIELLLSGIHCFLPKN
jgi:hypothetical protein